MIQSLLFVFGRFQRGVLILSGFAVFMVIGALLLMLPAAQTGTREIGFIDALFTSVSAVSVTGMSLINMREDLTLFGQLLMLFMIQVGGLGIMTIMAIMGISTGRRIRLQERLLIRDSFNLQTPSGMVLLVRKIIAMTFFVEFVSGTLLAIHFYREMGPAGIYYGYWHAVSAFCNCGLDLFGTGGFSPFARDPFVCAVVIVTMLLGGIGFVVIDDVLRKRSWSHLSLNSKLVLTAELFFTLFGAVVFFIMDRNNPRTMGDMNVFMEVLNSLFMSISSRLAGFTTFDIVDVSISTQLIVMLLMFTGSAPVSTGGGVRTTTVMIIFLSVLSWIRGKQDVVVFHKRISERSISKAFHIFTLSFALTFLTIFLLLLFDTRGFRLEEVLFEGVSAFSTVGFSVGLTDQWNDFCKIILIFAMFIGRIGVMTLVLAFAERHQGQVRYPTENVVIG